MIHCHKTRTRPREQIQILFRSISIFLWHAAALHRIFKTTHRISPVNVRSRRGNCAAGAVCFGLLGRVTTSLVTQPRSSSSLVSCLISDHVGPAGAGGLIILVPEEGPQFLDICGSQSWGPILASCTAVFFPRCLVSLGNRDQS